MIRKESLSLFDIDGKLFVDRTLSMIEDYFNLNMEFNMLEKDLITFKLTKTEWFLHHDRIQLSDCLEDVFESWFQYEDDPREAVTNLFSKVQDACYKEHKDGSCTVTLNLNNRWDLELWNESIDGNAMVCSWISEAKNGYIDSKSILTHCRNVNKKLDSIDPHGRYLWARWII